jgi:hypothetical protein
MFGGFQGIVKTIYNLVQGIFLTFYGFYKLTVYSSEKEVLDDAYKIVFLRFKMVVECSFGK